MARPEGENGEEQRTDRHPGWQRLGSALGVPSPFFDTILFLRGHGNFASNIYVVTGDDLAIVDPGNDYTAFMDLFALDIAPANIRKVVLTHGHPDHAMGAFELLRSYRGLIDTRRLELILHEAAPGQLKEWAKDAGCPVTEVRGGETIELSGLPWEVIHTPGHTIDGISLYHAPTKTAFTGDVALPDAVGAPDPYAGGDLGQYLFGLKALLKRQIDTVLPGHGLPVTPDGRRVIEETYECVMMKILGVETPIPWIEGATALAQRGLLEEALFCCDKVVARHPDDVRGLELKALCLNDLGRSHEALAVLDRLDALRGSDPALIAVGKGYALMGLGRYDESVRHFDEALRARPGLRDALVYKGMALYLAGHYEAAMDIDQFRTEFVARFKDEVAKQTGSRGASQTRNRAPRDPMMEEKPE